MLLLPEPVFRWQYKLYSITNPDLETCGETCFQAVATDSGEDPMYGANRLVWALRLALLVHELLQMCMSVAL